MLGCWLQFWAHTVPTGTGWTSAWGVTGVVERVLSERASECVREEFGGPQRACAHWLRAGLPL